MLICPLWFVWFIFNIIGDDGTPGLATSCNLPFVAGKCHDADLGWDGAEDEPCSNPFKPETKTNGFGKMCLCNGACVTANSSLSWLIWGIFTAGVIITSFILYYCTRDAPATTSEERIPFINTAEVRREVRREESKEEHTVPVEEDKESSDLEAAIIFHKC